jgi:dipeptidyl aminopeptidase/acylaminoacyl peptidase
MLCYENYAYKYSDLTMNKRVDKTIQELDIKSADGKSIYACLQKPQGNGPFPAVIFIHGGFGDNPEYTRAMLDWSVADLLSQEGFVVFSTDYRVDLSGKDIEDIAAAFAYIAKLPYVDEKKIAYFGDSHGSFLAIMAAAQTAPLALVHGWGIADMAEWYWHIKDIPASYYKKVSEDLEKSLGGTPDQVPDAYRQISPLTQARRIKCPVLILHGEKDDEVPVLHAYKLAEAFKEVGCEYELRVFKNAGHGLRTPEDRQEMDATVLKFILDLLD